MSGRGMPFAGALLAAGLASGWGFGDYRRATTIYLGSGERPRKGPPPKPTKKRAKVKAARKARQRARS